MDKAPDAFRTISEVADELDVPQHVLRFWETRFTQIKPMKRSGGRRFYRPDDVDLLRGIRRLLYADGYTIRGVQRILKEQGVKAVQGLDVAPQSVAEDAARVAAPARRRTPLPVLEDEPDDVAPEIEADALDEASDDHADDTSIVVRPPLPKPFTTPLPSLELRRSSGPTGMVPRAAAAQDIVPLRTAPRVNHTPPAYLPDLNFETPMPMPAPRRAVRQEQEERVVPIEPPPKPVVLDGKRLRPVLDELMAIRRLLDVAMQNGEPGAH